MGNKYFTEEITGKLVYDIKGQFMIMHHELNEYQDLDISFHDMMKIYDAFIRVCFIKDWIYSNREIDIVIGSEYKNCFSKYTEDNFANILTQYFQTFESVSRMGIHCINDKFWYLTDHTDYYNRYKKMCSIILDTFKSFTIELFEYIQKRKKLSIGLATVEEFCCYDDGSITFSRTSDEESSFIFIKSNLTSVFESGGTMVIRDSMSDEQKSSFENCITVSN